MDATSLWENLQHAAGQPDAGRTGLWVWLQEKLDLAMYRPQAAPGVVTSRLDGRDGPYTVIKNPAAKTYYQLSDRDTFLWELMDGTRTVKDLVVAYFGQYGSFAFGRVAGLVTGLRANGFLSDQPVEVYRQVHESLELRLPRVRLGRLWHAFLQTPVAISGLDGAVGRFYRGAGWLLFTWPAQILYVVLSLLGLVLYGKLFVSGTYSLLSTAGSYGLGLVVLIAAQFVAIFLHELAHALTVKHYGREVRRAGVLIYFGMPAFFVDTTDMWLEGKRPRLAVTWAGPYSGLILAGLVALVMVLWPALPVNPLLFKFAFTCYILVFINLNPLLELDGYYLLMDWLGISQLRRKSLEFLRIGLPARWREAWAKLTKSQHIWKGPSALFGVVRGLSAEERIFVVFGLLAAAWTAYAIYAGLAFWQARLAQNITGLWEGGSSVGRWAPGLLGIVISAVFVAILGMVPYRLARGWLAAAERRGLFRSLWRVLVLLVGASIILAFLPGLLGYPVVAGLVGMAALGVASYLGWRNARAYAGSRFAATFYAWAAAALALLLHELISLTLQQTLGPAGPGAWRALYLTTGFLGTAMLLLGSAWLFAGTNLRESSAVEKVALGLGCVAAYGLFVALAQSGWQAGGAASYLALNAVILPWLAAALLVPALFSFWQTHSAPAWIAIAASLVGLAVTALSRMPGRGLDLPPAFPYLLLAAGLYLQHLAYNRSVVTGEMPALVQERGKGASATHVRAADVSDASRLQHAFAWSVAAVQRQLSQIAGRRAAAAVVGQFNSYALAASWPLGVSSRPGEVQDLLPTDLSLVRRGEAYAAGLGLLLDLAADMMGEPLTVRALRRAFDSLPWEEREIGAQYLFNLMPRAASLSAAFHATSQDYSGLLRRMPLFATMSDAELALLAARLTSQHYKAGEAIIRQGVKGDRFYIVHRGHVEVSRRDERGISEVVNQLDRGGYFGELALLRDVPRTATCIATVPTELCCLSREDFDRLVKDRFAMREKLDRSVARAELLRRIPLFAEMDGSQIQLIAAEMQEEGYLA
ncbi:MAG TPA: cyclic nucleotide-binding domain-containing protein, partial [Anaerolineae bacterium]|nr:cyclic nucleotide-binding domain-containing protein [Anaerolineae bacterium]